jgi:hypothetical protein
MGGGWHKERGNEGEYGRQRFLIFLQADKWSTRFLFKSTRTFCLQTMAALLETFQGRVGWGQWKEIYLSFDF